MFDTKAGSISGRYRSHLANTRARAVSDRFQPVSHDIDRADHGRSGMYPPWTADAIGRMCEIAYYCMEVHLIVHYKALFTCNISQRRLLGAVLIRYGVPHIIVMRTLRKKTVATRITIARIELALMSIAYNYLHAHLIAYCKAWFTCNTSQSVVGCYTTNNGMEFLILL